LPADGDAGDSSGGGKVDVVLVPDIDMLHWRFLDMRSTPDAAMQSTFEFQNVPFVLNILGSLAGEDPRYSSILKRRQHYGKLTKFAERVEDIREDVDEIIDTAADEFNEITQKAEADRRETAEKWNKEVEKYQTADNPNIEELLNAQYRAQREINKMEAKEEAIKRQERRKRNKALARADEDRERKIRELETRYKSLAVFVPPIPPLVLALFVFLYRRSREKEGVARSRLR
jgi:ABC-2 type transport system permease protein